MVIVVAIMAVLIAVLAPQFIRYIEKSKQGKDADAAGVIWRAVNIAMADESTGSLKYGRHVISRMDRAGAASPR